MKTFSTQDERGGGVASGIAVADELCGLAGHVASVARDVAAAAAAVAR